MKFNSTFSSKGNTIYFLPLQYSVIIAFKLEFTKTNLFLNARSSTQAKTEYVIYSPTTDLINHCKGKRKAKKEKPFTICNFLQ